LITLSNYLLRSQILQLIPWDDLLQASSITFVW
jgi:hypothetical protein